MAVYVRINPCLKTNNLTPKVLKMSLDDLKEISVADVKLEFLSKTGVEECTFDLLYAGRVLDDDTSLDENGFKPNSTMYALPKPRAQENMEENETVTVGSKAELFHLARMIEVVLRGKGLKNTLELYEKIVENILEAMPSLRRDPTAVVLLHDPQLTMMYIKNKESCDNLISRHPLILQAAALIAPELEQEIISSRKERKKATAGASTSGPGTSGLSGSYSLEAMSDADEYDDEGEGASTSSSAQASARAGPPVLVRPFGGGGGGPVFAGVTGMQPGQPAASSITPQLLASALAQATNPTPGRTPQPPPSAPPPATPITADMFRSAMATAMATSPTNVDVQVQRLRDMGITDEQLARRALVATNGDVTAALDLIFSEKNND